MKKGLLLVMLLSSFQTFAQTKVHIPDENFEQALIDLGLDSGIVDGYVARSNINTITSLNVADKNISDLTGIEHFVALEALYCSENNLRVLNISKNSKLRILRCYANILKNLDVSKNPDLITLSCNINRLSALDVRKNPRLKQLSFGRNKITGIDVTKNPSLEFLDLAQNKLRTLNVHKNAALVHINCSNNELTSLNLANRNNTAITYFNASNNELACIKVDDSAYSTKFWTRMDEGTIFDESCR